MSHGHESSRFQPAHANCSQASWQVIFMPARKSWQEELHTRMTGCEKHVFCLGRSTFATLARMNTEETKVLSQHSFFSNLSRNTIAAFLLGVLQALWQHLLFRPNCCSHGVWLLVCFLLRWADCAIAAHLPIFS